MSGDWKWTRAKVLGALRGLLNSVTRCVNGVTWSFVLKEVACEQGQQMQK